MECKNCKKCAVSCLMHNNDKNPFPYLTPSLCDHACKYKCTFKADFREEEILDGIVKFKELTRYPKAKKSNIFILGSGVSGLTVAHLLLKAGIKPTLCKKSVLGGTLIDVIPNERIRNLDLFKKHAKIIYKKCRKAKSQNKNDIVIDCTGVKEENRLYSNHLNAVGGVEFLKLLKSGVSLDVLDLQKVAVVGLGNTACDVITQVYNFLNIKPTVFYRRTATESHANKEELERALAFCNLREKTMPTEAEVSNYDLVVECIGFKKPDYLAREIYDNYKILLDGRYVCGDAAYGSDTVNRAIQSGIDVATDLLNRKEIKYERKN